VHNFSFLVDFPASTWPIQSKPGRKSFGTHFWPVSWPFSVTVPVPPPTTHAGGVSLNQLATLH